MVDGLVALLQPVLVERRHVGDLCLQLAVAVFQQLTEQALGQDNNMMLLIEY